MVFHALNRGVGGSERDPFGNETAFILDRFGFPLSTTDALGNETIYERNANGLATRIIEPDPDGTGPLTAPETLFSYDVYGNLLEMTLPDGSTRQWTYDVVWNQVTSFIDELGNETRYTLDSADGMVTEIIAAYGVINATTAFTYTSPPSGPTDPPPGLVETITDANGVVTRYHYNQRGLPVEVTFAEGTGSRDGDSQLTGQHAGRGQPRDGPVRT